MALINPNMINQNILTSSSKIKAKVDKIDSKFATEVYNPLGDNMPTPGTCALPISLVGKNIGKFLFKSLCGGWVGVAISIGLTAGEVAYDCIANDKSLKDSVRDNTFLGGCFLS